MRKKRKLIFDEAGLKAFAKRFVELREGKGFTQESLASKSGITLSTIARIETARVNPTLSTIFALLKAMDAELSDLDFKLPR